jgi:heat induced stress protein YflT
MARSLVGLFPDRAAAERAIQSLRAAGFDPSRIGIVLRERDEARAVAQEHTLNAAAGAVTGGVIGGGAGTLLAATGALVVPGIGPFISGGILATALVGGAVGWLVGGLVGLGIPREEAEYYQGRVEQGSALVTVDAAGREAEARRILLDNGAEDLRERFGDGTPVADTTGTAAYRGAAPESPTVPGTPTETYVPGPQPGYPPSTEAPLPSAYPHPGADADTAAPSPQPDAAASARPTYDADIIRAGEAERRERAEAGRDPS